MVKCDEILTYINDIVEGVIRVLDRPPAGNQIWSGKNPDPATSTAPYKLYNIGNNQPVELMRFIEVLEKALGKKARKNMLPLQPGDVPVNYADVSDLIKDTGFSPNTSIEVGIKKFVDWYKHYYNI